MSQWILDQQEDGNWRLQLWRGHFRTIDTVNVTLTKREFDDLSRLIAKARGES